MRIRRLLTRFILAGSLLALITVGSGFWSAWTFARLATVADQVLHDSQATIDSAAALADSLEREDDALLLALSGNIPLALSTLKDERQRGDDRYRQLQARLIAENGNGASVLERLRDAIDAYRNAGSSLIQEANQPDALIRYHEQVNPLLRRAIRSCGEIREQHFSSMRLVAVRARDQARAATRIIVAASLAALLLATIIAAWLTRSVVQPIATLTSSVDAVRLGDFDHRIKSSSQDELGQLATGFNRMAETLAEYRRSSLGELLAAKMTLEATLEALPDAVIVIAPDGRVAALNPAALQFLHARGIPNAHQINDLPLSPQHREAVEAALAGRAALASRTNLNHLIQARLNGQPRKFLLTAVPIPEFSPQQTGALIVLDDVTEFALLDELRSELVAVASHELKTPLTTVRMNLMLLGESTETFTPRQREMLEAARLGCEELGNTTDELLDMAQIEAGQLRLDLLPVDLGTILESAIQSLQNRLHDANLQLDVRRSAPSTIIHGDAKRLRNVITNLLANALKYSPPGGRITVEIASRQGASPREPQTLHFAVTDEGPGIPEPFRERVFEKFFRIENNLDTAPKGSRGTGIGLYLCRQIITAHGGSILCKPGPEGRGTTVAFTIPRSG